MSLVKRIKPNSNQQQQRPAPGPFTPLVGTHKSWREYWKLVRPRLLERADGFYKIFEHLEKNNDSGYPFCIVETGTLREPHNYEGDGNSSSLFDNFIEYNVGTFHTVDIDPAACDSARKHLKNALVHESDSVEWLSTFNKEIDVLYLDSYNIDDWNNDWAAAAHHLKELFACQYCLSPGSLVVVDDNVRNPHTGKKIGKGRLVRELLEVCPGKAELIHDGYQEIWEWLEG